MNREGGANQYGFYAVPKAVEPRRKYRDSDENGEQNISQNDEINLVTIDRDAITEPSRDFYVDEAPYPEFKPKERGLDYGVQIDENDLFDFPTQVRPLVEVLVGRSVLTAITELQEERESSDRVQKLDTFQKKRNAQLMVTQRMEAKDKRKKEEIDRRKLQQEAYLVAQRETIKKLIAKKNAKIGLLGLREQLFNELEDEGHLKAEPLNELKVNFEGWLYDLIVSQLRLEEGSRNVAQHLISEEEARRWKEHAEAIRKEQTRRQSIVDERQRLRHESQQLKMRKKIKKQRQQLHSQREAAFAKLEELIERSQQVPSIIGATALHNGMVRSTLGSHVFVTGGLTNFLLVALDSMGGNLTPEEITDLILKLLADNNCRLEIPVNRASAQLYEAAKKLLEENPNEFLNMKKDETLKNLRNSMAIDTSIPSECGIQVCDRLQGAFISAVAEITLTAPFKPIPPIEGEGELVTPESSEHQKRCMAVAGRIDFVSLDARQADAIAAVDRVLRVRFEREVPENEQVDQDYIDVYDGQGWEELKKEHPKELNREGQHPTAISVNGLDNSYIFDERSLHFLRLQVEAQIGAILGPKIKQYLKQLETIEKLRKGKDVPIYDVQLREQ